MPGKFEVLEQCLGVVHRCILDEPFALLTEQFLRVRIVTELCRSGITIEESSRAGGKYSTHVVFSNPGTKGERVQYHFDDRSEINITKGYNVDIKVAGSDPFSLELKCKGDFGSNSILRDKICDDMYRILAVKGIADFLILATTVPGFQDLCGYTYQRDGVSERFADAVPPFSEIGIDQFTDHKCIWAGGSIAVRARRVKTRFYETERVILAFWDI